jgi:hypothetical protein
MKRVFFACVLAFVLALSAATAMAGPLTFTIYTNYNQWWQATQTWQHYPFTNVQSLGFNQSVSTTTGSFGPPRGVFPAGTNVWNDRVTEAGGEVTTFWLSDTTMTSNGMWAFGGYWDFSPGGWGQGLTLTVGIMPFGSEHVQDICGDVISGCIGGPTQSTLVPDGTWFGIVADGPFRTISISADHQSGSAETFDLSAFDMARPTPEPGTLILLGTGILGLAGTLRRKLF